MSEEMIDILDAQGTQTGRTILKSEAHRLGEWHRAVHVWVVTPKGELLLQRRAPNKDTYPNRWDISSAGHISAGENSHEASFREMQEELGLDIDTSELEFLGNVRIESIYKNGIYIDREYHDIYLITKEVSLKQLKMQESEITDLQFLPWTDVCESIAKNDPEFVPHDEEYKLLFSILEQRYPNAHPS